MNSKILLVLLGVLTLSVMVGCSSAPSEAPKSEASAESRKPTEVEKPVSHMPAEAVEAMKARQANQPGNAGPK